MVRKTLLTVFVSFSVCLFSVAQNTQQSKQLNLNDLQIQSHELPNLISEIAGEKNFELKLISRSKAKTNRSHSRYQLYHNNIPIEGSVLLTHGKSGQINSINGLFPVNANFRGTRILNNQEAIQAAMNHHEGGLYAWQDEATERILRKTENDPSATFYPTPELVYVDKAFPETSGELFLAYKLELYSLAPLSRKEYFINATNGEVLHEIEQIHTTSVEGTAETKYSGQRTIITDSVGPNEYRLLDTTRGGGIQTLNMRESFFYDFAIDFTDSNNVWDNFNEDIDEIATDAHWGMEMTYDYMDQAHGWKSFDNDDAKMLAYVHYGKDYVNAFWNGRWTTYGDGRDNAGYGPLTSVDVVGHEFTHGIVDYTADLVYRNEPGALNESFCDILGSCIEYYADTSMFDWFIGEDFTHNGIRSMSNPNLHQNPDTYHGKFWEFGNFDNGGVHINSGVQNKWFQLLVDGGNGVNDNGDTFTVTGIGIDTSAAVAFHNLRYYLTRTSQFEDARWGSIQSAIELYGMESQAVVSVMEAWHAVGLGHPSSPFDVSFEQLQSPSTNGCQLFDHEEIAIRLTLNSNADTIFQGDSIMIGYVFDGDTVAPRSFTIESDVLPLESFVIDSIGFIDLGESGKKSFRIFYTYAFDSNAANDTFSLEFNTAKHQTTDIGVDRILIANQACIPVDGEVLTIDLRYFGCDSFPPQDVPVSYFINGDTVNEMITVDKAIYPGDNHIVSFTEKLNFPYVGDYTIKVWTDLQADENGNNNAETETIKRTHVYSPGSTISFESIIVSEDSLVLSTGRDANMHIRGSARSKGLYGLLMTGNTIVNDRHRYSIPDSFNIWNSNNRFESRACVCVDASEFVDNFNLQFDLKQSYSPYHQKLIFQDLPLASSFRVTANGTQVSTDYWPATHMDDTFQTHTINLDTFAGKFFELCFEARNFISGTDDVDTGIGDNVYLDNVLIGTNPVGIDEQTEPRVKINVYPNPVSNSELVIESDTDIFLGAIEIFNLEGKRYEVFTGEGQRQLINISNLPNGYYIISIKTSRGVIKRKFVKI